MKEKKLDMANIYQHQIFRYLKDYFPHLFDNREEVTEMIIDRADKANEAYLQASREGKNHIEASEIANQVLHADLEFSPISYLRELWEEKKGDELSNEQAIAIYRKTKPVFEKYGRDIEGAEDEWLLVDELIPYLTV